MWNRILTSIVILFLFLPLNGQTDKLEEGFALYLFDHELFDFASEEFERLLFKEPGNIEYLEKLIFCYRKSKTKDLFQNRLTDLEISDKQVFIPYYKLLITKGFQQEAKQLLASEKFPLEKSELSELNFLTKLTESKWDQAIVQYNDEAHLKNYEGLISLIQNRSYKSPVKAALLSGIVPGLGRVYANDIKDAVISFIFVASTAYQSYRRFQKNGISSVGGWIYGGFAAGFYVSNIYGSYVSAKNYNKRINAALHEKSLYYINADISN